MIEKVYTIDEIRQAVAPIAARYGVDRVFLFGSYARGNANGSSDIDFAIEKGKIHGLQFAGMLGDLLEVFNKKVDLLTVSCIRENIENTGFCDRFERDKVVVYEQ